MKMIGAAAFKTHCLRILDEVNATGESVTITKRGKVMCVLNPGVVKAACSLPPLFGVLKSDSYSFDDPFSPAEDLWDEAFDRKWDQFL